MSETKESYYAGQASSLPYFSGQHIQKRSGFGALGALASGIGKISFTLAQKLIQPAAKRKGKDKAYQS